MSAGDGKEEVRVTLSTAYKCNIVFDVISVTCRDTALAISRIHFEFIKGHFKDDEGNFHVKSLKTDIVTSPIEMLLSKVSGLGLSFSTSTVIISCFVGQPFITPNQ